jgi:tetratricopeptide (TPR) repeat protein
LLWAVTAFALVANGCFGGGGGDQGGAATSLSKEKAGDVKPPEPVDSKATAQPGLVLFPNTPSLQRLTGAPKGKGVVVLFVQPGGPSDRKGIARGDLLTEVNGTKVSNQENALALLRLRPGEKVKLAFTRQDNTERTIEIEERDPGNITLAQFLNPIIENSPSDPILRYLRATSTGSTQDRLADLRRAIQADPRFVEALTLRASLLWDQSLGTRKKKERVQLQNTAFAGWKNALDIDPENTTTLAVQAVAIATIGNGRKAREDAQHALAVDKTQPRAYYALALSELTLNHAERAAGPARAAVEVAPYTPLYYRVLARTFFALKRRDDCRKTTDAVIPFLQTYRLTDDIKLMQDACTR